MQSITFKTLVIHSQGSEDLYLKNVYRTIVAILPCFYSAGHAWPIVGQPIFLPHIA